MNRKGFTLVELIAVIALLAIIAIISFVSINSVIDKSKVSDCENLKLSIETATKEYVSDNRYDFSNNGTKTIYANNLINGKYLSSPIKDPFNSSNNLDADKIKIIVTLKDDFSADTITIYNSSGKSIDCSSNKW